MSLSCGSLWFIDAGSVDFVDKPISRRYLTQDDRIDTLLHTSKEWFWALDDQGMFTFSSKTSAAILGYQHGN